MFVGVLVLGLDGLACGSSHRATGALTPTALYRALLDTAVPRSTFPLHAPAVVVAPNELNAVAKSHGAIGEVQLFATTSGETANVLYLIFRAHNNAESDPHPYPGLGKVVTRSPIPSSFPKPGSLTLRRVTDRTIPGKPLKATSSTVEFVDGNVSVAATAVSATKSRTALQSESIRLAEFALHHLSKVRGS